MLSLDERRKIMVAANTQPLLINGVLVAVSGTYNSFARVMIADRKHPFYGWATEYAWETIARIVKAGGTCPQC